MTTVARAKPGPGPREAKGRQRWSQAAQPAAADPAVASELAIQTRRLTKVYRKGSTAVLAPVGHGAWTGFVCAVLWRERERGAPTSHAVLAVGGAFLSAAVLHAVWDSLAGASGAAPVESLGLELLSLCVAIASLVLFVHVLREASHPHSPAVAEQPD